MPPAPASPRRPRLDRTAAHVCLCAFLLQCKPSEPHLVPYLTDVKGFSSAQVEADILPVSVYASLVFFLLAGPAASATSTKTVLVAGGACKLLTRVLLLWGRTLVDMHLMQVAFAAGAASDLMLFAYLAETAPRESDLDVVRDASNSIPGEGGEVGVGHERSGPDARLTDNSRVRFATGAASASAMLGYMLAAELGQIAFERGASYESLFAASLVAVALGCVFLATLPGDGDANARKRRDGGNALDAPGASTSTARSPSQDARHRAFGSTFGSYIKPIRARLVDAVVKACASCYGSSAAIALSTWWIIGTPPATTLETYVLSLLHDVEEGGNDRAGHVVFFTRAASAAAAAAAARAPEAVASAPETYAAASAAVCVSAAVFSVSNSVATASVAYTLAVACVHGVSVLAFAQTSLCAAAARRGAENNAYAEMAEDGADGVTVGSSAADAEQEHGVGSTLTTSSRDGLRKSDDGLLFGLNSFFALVVLVLAQASVDASRGGARGAAAAAAAVAALAAAVVVFAAFTRRFLSGAEWAFAPTPSDVSYEWLRRLTRSCE